MNTAEATENTVTIIPVENHGDLHHQYPGQTSPQDVHVILNCDESTLTAGWDGIIGAGMPMNVYHRRTLRWRIPALTADAANALLDELLPQMETIVAGYSCEWDGNNHVGRYTDEAANAIEAVAGMLESRSFDGHVIEVWDAADWFGGVGSHDAQRRELGITAQTTDEDLAAIVEREETNAEARIINRMEKHLTMLRDEAAEDEDSE
jgi:hypothetical protein